MTSPNPERHLVEGPRDPEHDATATYVLEPSYVSRLTDRIIATSGETKPAISPINLAPLAVIPQSTQADVETAFERARAAQKEWAQTSFAERERLLLKLHDVVLARQSEIADVVVLESAKARKDAFAEVLHVALTARYYGRTLSKHLASPRRPGVFPVLTNVHVNRVPKGVVGIISPWNYPFTMALVDGLAAVAAGNAVVSKPDAQTMLSALLAAELLDEAGFPKGLWNVVAGPGSRVGTNIIERADYICFTGSTATGKLIAKQCAERLIGCSLELGGKNPMLILADADVSKAADGAVRAVYSNAGQLCVSIERLFVADEIYDEFKAQFVARTKALTLGATLDWENDMGSLISQDQLDTAVAHVEDARSKGATVLAGGQARPDLSPYFFEPTILEGVTPEMTCHSHETFGPVVSIYRFKTEDEAINLANEGEYGLNGSIFSKDVKRAREIARQIKCGTININEAYAATFASIDAPMGGMRESGTGRRQGAEGLLRYTETQSVASQALVPLAPSFGLSEEQYAKVMLASVKILKAVGRA